MLRNTKTYIFFTAISLLLICVITYGDILTHQFMIDERLYVKPDAVSFTNEHIYLDPSATIYSYYHHLGDFFKKSIYRHYAPLNFLLNVELFRHFHEARPLYLINLLLFYVNCGLLFLFVYLISGEYITALLTSLLFCVHPMTGDMLEHITFNIIFVQTILMELALITLYLYAKNKKDPAYYIFSLLMVFVGLFCHELIVSFPLYAAVLLFFLTDLKFKKIIKIVVPFVFLSFLLISLWLCINNPHVHLENILIPHLGSIWTLTANFSRLFFWYLSNLFVPRDIVFMANLPSLNGSIVWWNFLLFGFWTACGLFIFYCLGKSLEAFALVFFLIGFVFAVPCSIARLQDGGDWVFEPNWVYFSSIGFYLFIVLILLRLRKYINKFLFFILLIAILLCYFSSTMNLNIMSRTERSYAENWLRKFPGNFIAIKIVGAFYANHENAKIPPDLIPDMLHQADAYLNDNDTQTPGLIERILSSGISDAKKAELSLKMADYYYKNGRNEPAIDLLKKCISLYPKYKEPYLLIGVILGNEGHYDESISFWKQGLRSDPTDARFTLNINKAEKLIHLRPRD